MTTETMTTDKPTVYLIDPATCQRRTCTVLDVRRVGTYEDRPVTLMLVEDEEEKYFQVLRYTSFKEDFVREVQEPQLPEPAEDRTLLTLCEWDSDL